MATRKPYPSAMSDEEWIFVAPCRMLPNDFPPWAAVYQQIQRWLAAGCFDAMAQDLRVMLRLAKGRKTDSSTAIFDSRTIQSSRGSGKQAEYDGHKRKKGSKVHMVVNTLGRLLATFVIPANQQERAQVRQLA